MDTIYLKPLIEKKINELGYDLVEISARREKGDLILSIVVDRVEPIDMNAIVEVSEKVSTYLDEIDTSEDVYTLDVSSLGAEKPLKIDQLHLYVGRYVNVHLINPIDGENIYEGDLVDVKDESITLSYRQKTRTKTVDITKSNISKIRLAIKF